MAQSGQRLGLTTAQITALRDLGWANLHKRRAPRPDMPPEIVFQVEQAAVDAGMTIPLPYR